MGRSRERDRRLDRRDEGARRGPKTPPEHGMNNASGGKKE